MGRSVPISVTNAFLYGFNKWLPHFVINWFLANLQPSGASDRQRLMRVLHLVEDFRERHFSFCEAPTPQMSPVKNMAASDDEAQDDEHWRKGPLKRLKKA